MVATTLTTVVIVMAATSNVVTASAFHLVLRCTTSVVCVEAVVPGCAVGSVSWMGAKMKPCVLPFS